MKARVRKKLHPTGQLSIFAILIFQVLFILFAMSLNIALVVHDKINLQNSVDIAAYYGAMKQAEMMNAIAHINYQIRQSWKLLTWRYRVLGSVGATDTTLRLTTPNDTEHHLPVFKDPIDEGPYFFCVGHKDWGGFIDHETLAPRSGPPLGTDNLCMRMNKDIDPPTVPRVTGTLGSFSDLLDEIRNMGISVGAELDRKCNFYGFNSWLLGITAFVHFRKDQSDRKYMIHELAKLLSEGKGKDLDDRLIKEGVEKTFEKNLSFINKNSFNKDRNQLKHFSSLEGAAPDEWLRDQFFYDLGLYSNFHGSGGCKKQLSFLNTPPVSANSYPLKDSFINQIGRHDPWPACAGSKQCEASAGLRKIKNFIVFYSVKAELDYEKQIFLPFSQNIILKAKAFAKPFGGRIGPNTEDPGTSVDKRLPLPTLPYITSPIDIDKYHTPNYSRYPGDPWGLRSKVVHHHWAKYIKSHPPSNALQNYLKTIYPDENDPLARNPSLGHPPGIMARKWELAAVAPDLFDVTYFTILPYYKGAYFPKIRNLIPNKNHLRGDFGMYRGSLPDHFGGKGILKQVGYGSRPETDVWSDIRYLPGFPAHIVSLYSSFNKPFYKIKSLNLLLTGWNPPKEKYRPGDNDYEAASDKTNFGKCFLWVHDAGIVPHSSDTRGKIANGCIYGGRTGYSVKMISEGFLRGFTSPINSFPIGDLEWYSPY